MKKILANKKQIEAIKNYIASRFASYGIVEYKFEIEETDRLTYGQRISQEIELKYLGIFRHALKKCTLNIEVWRRDGDSRSNICSVGLRYEHFDGGSNGCNIECTLIVDTDGNIVEKYRFVTIL